MEERERERRREVRCGAGLGMAGGFESVSVMHSHQAANARRACEPVLAFLKNEAVLGEAMTSRGDSAWFSPGL